VSCVHCLGASIMLGWLLTLTLLATMAAPAIAASYEPTCLAAAWLPKDTVPEPQEDCLDWDNSRVPDCSKFSGQVNTTSFYHVHEYDCGLFWECGPKNEQGEHTVCLFECGACHVSPDRCPDGRLQFDCRYRWPDGPVCDWADNVHCLNCQKECEALDCPEEQNCDPTTDCKCSDCRDDSDCTGGQMCCDRNCADDCDGSTTDSQHSTTQSQTTTECPDECCSDDDCEAPLVCLDGECKCPTECCSDEDCPDPYVCEDGECKCPDECCADIECPPGEVCLDGKCVGTTTPHSDSTTACDDECCSDLDCPPGQLCVDGKCRDACKEDSECDGFDAICNVPIYDNCFWCDGRACRPGCAGDDNCPSNSPMCSGIHNCGAGFPGLVKVTIATYDCTGCPDADMQPEEGGIIIAPEDPKGQTCTSDGLDNMDTIDYTNGNTADFVAEEEDGLGNCKYANLNFHVTSGKVTWTGTGTWTGVSKNPICFYYYDDVAEFYKIYNCCDLVESGLAQGQSTQLTNCRQCLYGQECS